MAAIPQVPTDHLHTKLHTLGKEKHLKRTTLWETLSYIIYKNILLPFTETL